MTRKVLLVLSRGVFEPRGLRLKDYFSRACVGVVEIDPASPGSLAVTEIGEVVKRLQPSHIVFCHGGHIRAATVVKDQTNSWNPRPILAIVSGNFSELQQFKEAGFIPLSDVPGSYHPDYVHLREEEEVVKALGLKPE